MTSYAIFHPDSTLSVTDEGYRAALAEQRGCRVLPTAAEWWTWGACFRRADLPALETAEAIYNRICGREI